MKHKTFKEFLLESRLREFRGWWKVGESEPKYIWSNDDPDRQGRKGEHGYVIQLLDPPINKKFSQMNPKDVRLEGILEYAFTRGWIRFGQSRRAIYGPQTYIHFDETLGISAFRTVLKIIDWLNLDNDDSISISGKRNIYGNYELQSTLSVQHIKYYLNQRLGEIKTATATEK